MPNRQSRIGIAWSLGRKSAGAGGHGATNAREPMESWHTGIARSLACHGWLVSHGAGADTKRRGGPFAGQAEVWGERTALAANKLVREKADAKLLTLERRRQVADAVVVHVQLLADCLAAWLPCRMPSCLSACLPRKYPSLPPFSPSLSACMLPLWLTGSG